MFYVLISLVLSFGIIWGIRIQDTKMQIIHMA